MAKEAPRLRFSQTVPELEGGLPSVSEKPGLLFDEGENIIREATLPADKEGGRPIIVPLSFRKTLKDLPREEALRVLRAFAEQRFKEVQDAGIACEPRTISTDVWIDNLKKSSKGKAPRRAQQKQRLLIAAPKIKDFIQVQHDNLGALDSLTPVQRQQWYSDCLVLYRKLLTYYRGQWPDKRSPKPENPVMWDISSLRQYAYLPEGPDQNKRFVLLDVGLVAGDDAFVPLTFIGRALNALEDVKARAARDGQSATPFDALITEFTAELG